LSKLRVSFEDLFTGPSVLLFGNLNMVALVNVHYKKCWVVLTQFWVKYGQTQLLD